MSISFCRTSLIDHLYLNKYEQINIHKMWFSKLATIAVLTIVNIGHTTLKYDPAKIGKLIPAKLFAKTEATQILGTATHLTDSVSKKEVSSSTYLCGYKANLADPKTGKIGAVYFLFEDYQVVDGAIKRFSDVYLSNRTHGMVKIANLGDEAVYHTDNQNFDLMMVRKGKYVFNIKINSRTSTSSLGELEKIVKKITKKI